MHYAGGSGYDVVSASTNFFSREIKAGVYRPLDKSKLPNWKNLDPKVLARQLPADPANAHLTFIRLTSRRDVARFLASPRGYTG